MTKAPRAGQAAFASSPARKHISEAHALMLRESGLSDETVRLAELETEQDHEIVCSHLGWTHRPGERTLGDCLVFPCIEPGQTIPYAYRVRPDKPRSESRDGKERVRKYESPKGAGVITYFPPRARQEGSYSNASTPLIWTEGEKKALLLDQLGYPCVGLTGVWNAHDPAIRNPPGQPTGSGPWVLHPRITQHVTVKGRDHIICFDSDVRENDGVMRAARNLARMLRALGARTVRLAVPPSGNDGQKHGIDDFYVVMAREELARGRSAVETLLAAADDTALNVPTSAPLRLLRNTPPPRGSQLTDLGNAERLALRHGHRLRFVGVHKKWYTWTGQRWAVDDTGEVSRLAAETVRALYAEAAQTENDLERLALVQHAQRSESGARLNAMVSLAATQEEVVARPSDFDGDHMLLNTPTGTIDLRTGRLRPHSAQDMITKMTSAPFDPAALCPTWERFLDDCMDGDPEVVAYLQRIVGYSLTGSVREHALFFLYGDGCNGKSTFVDTLLHALGDYATPGAPNLLLEKRNESHPTEQADLHGARFVSLQEVDQGRGWAESTLKALTGGDPVKARRMKEDFWTFDPTHKFWVSGNHKPSVKGADAGIWRRMRLIPFTVSFLGREDKMLNSKLAAEAPGILAWAVRGCAEWQAVGESPPSRVLVATASYQQESDDFGRFIAENCIFEPNARLANGELRGAYDEWCREQGLEPPRADLFAGLRRAAAAHGLEITTGAMRFYGRPVRGWFGVRLKTPVELGLAERDDGPLF